jgi:protein-tyrosine phosphatase
MTSWPTGRSRDGGIDEIPLPRSEGRLWLCGKHVVGPDPEGALALVGAGVVVCLTQAGELSDRYPDYVTWLHANRGRRAMWFPIDDLHAPTVERAAPFIDEIVTRLDGGGALVMHCAAGIGRSGTMAVGVLLAMGMALDDALALVAAHRPMAGPEVGAQRALVDALAARQA